MLSAAGDPLEKLSALIDCEISQPAQDAALQNSDDNKCSRPPLDAVIMFKTMILHTLYGCRVRKPCARSSTGAALRASSASSMATTRPTRRRCGSFLRSCLRGLTSTQRFGLSGHGRTEHRCKHHLCSASAYDRREARHPQGLWHRGKLDRPSSTASPRSTGSPTPSSASSANTPVKNSISSCHGCSSPEGPWNTAYGRYAANSCHSAPP